MARCLTVLTRTETTHLCLCVCVFVCIQCVCVWVGGICPNFKKMYVYKYITCAFRFSLVCWMFWHVRFGGFTSFEGLGGPSLWPVETAILPLTRVFRMVLDDHHLSLSFSKENIDVVAWTVWWGVWLFKKWPFTDVDDKHLWLTQPGLIRLKHAQPFLIC